MGQEYFDWTQAAPELPLTHSANKRLAVKRHDVEPLYDPLKEVCCCRRWFCATGKSPDTIPHRRRAHSLPPFVVREPIHWCAGTGRSIRRRCTPVQAPWTSFVDTWPAHDQTNRVGNDALVCSSKTPSPWPSRCIHGGMGNGRLGSMEAAIDEA